MADLVVASAACLCFFAIKSFNDFHLFFQTIPIGILLKNSTRDFQNSSPFDRSTCIYVTISGSFKHFYYNNFNSNFLENENLFQKAGVPFFS